MTSLTHRQAACAASVEAETFANVWQVIRAGEAEERRYQTDPVYRAEQDADRARRQAVAHRRMDETRAEFLRGLLGEAE